jgi:hypothetical protein
MLRPIGLVIFVAGFAASAAAQQKSLGVFGLWGAFQDGGRCYAIAEPVRQSVRGTRPYASVGNWPGRGVRGQLHIRLSGEQRERSAVLLRIDGRSFQLTGRGWDAWAPDARGDAELLAAMRTGIAMTVESRGAAGRLIRDHYQLRGAASAIDAATLACLRG